MRTPHLKPKGVRGMKQVEKIGRRYKTGGFNKIANLATKRYRSKKIGNKVAGAVFQRMIKKHLTY
jgi:hypothetical protein